MRRLSGVVLAGACLAVLLPHMVSLRLVACQRDESCTNPDAAADSDSSPAAQARSYDKILGSAQHGARYQFRPEQHYVFEGAQLLLDAGLSSFKFKLQPESASGVIADVSKKKPPSMLQVLKSKDFPYQSVLDLPFRSFHIVIGSHEQRNLAEEEVDWYNQVYNLASYLINRYKGSGKTFYLAAEQADLRIRQQPSGKAAAAAVTAATPLDPERQEMLGKMWWEQQAAVDDARADHADNLKGVQVFSYVEMNFMKNASIDFTVIDDIIPNLDPTPDYVGVSLSSLPDYTNAADLNTLSSKISKLLDYVAGKLTEKEGVDGPRVVVSEVAFPLRTAAGTDSDVTGTQQLQAQHALTVAAACIAWGTPSISYATLYDSTTTAKNTAAVRVLAGAAAGMDTYQDLGVALVEKDGKDTVLYTALKSYAKQANMWLEALVEATKELPCRDHFRVWAVEALTSLANDVTGAAKLAAPSVTFRYGCKGLVAKS